jgi:hypothetical protein
VQTTVYLDSGDCVILRVSILVVTAEPRRLVHCRAQGLDLLVKTRNVALLLVNEGKLLFDFLARLLQPLVQLGPLLRTPV